MITLYTFGPAYGLPDPSPFVMKTEMLLKLAGLDYQKSRGVMRKAPKGKLPYIEDDGAYIADSTFIRWHLEDKYQVDFDRHLSETDKAIAWSVDKMLEDNLYWILVESRWLDDENFARGPSRMFAAIPWPIRSLVTGMIRRSINRTLQGQGTSRHSPKEIARIAARDIDTLSTLLGDKPFLMGDQPCGADATAFAFIAHLLCPLFDTSLRAATADHKNLVAYADRMMRAYYPEMCP